MKIIKNKEPFPHIFIEDYFNKLEISQIWTELEFLSYVQKLKSPEETSTAKTKDSVLLKNNFGVHLDTLYSKREISNILTFNRKIFDKNFIDEIGEFDFSFKNFKVCNLDYTLLSYYENFGYYKPHADVSTYTALTWIYKEPKMFLGGDLFFPEYDYKIEIKNNSLLLFNSAILHQVVEIKMENCSINQFGMFSGNGRYCISQFCTSNYFLR
jgi:hypothetical protein